MALRVCLDLVAQLGCRMGGMLAWVEETWRSAGSPGLAIGTVADGRPGEQLCLGERVVGAPVTADTVFDAASLTKPVFSRYVVELAERGEVDLEEPLGVPEAAVGALPDERWRRLTAAMVLSHRTGLPNWRETGQPLRLVADPDTRFVYSGEGFELLLRSLQVRRGPDRVLAELNDLLATTGMTNSSFVDAAGQPADQAVGHTADGRPVVRSPRHRLGAYGTLNTTLTDYLRFLSSTFGTPGWVRDQLSIPVADGVRTLGWGVWRLADPVLWQNGDNPGFEHLALVVPSELTGIVAFTNSDAGRRFTDELRIRWCGGTE